MSVVAKRLVVLAMSHGLEPSAIWEMSLAQFAAAIVEARRAGRN